MLAGVNSTSTNAPAVVADRPATFRDVFAVAEFRVLFASFGVFMIGETVKMLALSVLVYERTGSGLLAALAYVTGFLPHALGGLFLLALADRWPARALIVGYDLVRLAMVAVLATGALSPGAMLGLVAVVGLFGPVSSASRTALLPEVLDGDAYVLGRSLLTVAAGGTQVAGFALGGLLLGLVGPYGALWLTAVTCGLSALLVRVGLARRPARARSGQAGDDPASGGAVRETLRVNRQLLADRRIRGLLLAQWLPGSLLVGAEGVAVPYAADLGPGASAGVLLMAGAGGMLVGDLLVGRFVAPARRERWSPWLALLLGVPLVVFLAARRRPPRWRPGPAPADAAHRWGPALPVAVWLVLSYATPLAVPASDWGRTVTPVELVVTLLVAFAVNALLEEVFYRRWLQTRWESMLGRWPAIVLASLVWAVWHVAIQGSGRPAVDLATVLVNHGVLGLFLGYLWSRYRRMWPLLVVHGALNAMPTLTGL